MELEYMPHTFIFEWTSTPASFIASNRTAEFHQTLPESAYADIRSYLKQGDNPGSSFASAAYGSGMKSAIKGAA